MKINLLSSDAKKEKKAIPHLWFAWFPVRVNDKQIAWLEYVYRYLVIDNGPYGKLITEYKYISVEDFAYAFPVKEDIPE